MKELYQSPGPQVEAIVAHHVFAWIGEECDSPGEATKRFVLSFTPQAFLTVDTYKLASKLIEKMNLRYMEMYRFLKCNAKFHQVIEWPIPEFCATRNTAHLHLLGTAIYTEIFSSLIKIAPSDSRYPRFQECYSLHLRVNGVDLKHTDEMRTSDAARCILAAFMNDPKIQHTVRVKPYSHDVISN